MDLTAAEHLAKDLMREHELTDRWSFGFDRAVQRLGSCSYTRRRISLSAVYVASADASMVRETVLHEIAHALAFERYPGKRVGHGPLWKQIAREVGCPPSSTGHNPAAAAQDDDDRATALAKAHSFREPTHGGHARRLGAGARVVLTSPLSRQRGDVFTIIRHTRGNNYRAVHAVTGRQWRLRADQFRLHVTGEPLDRIEVEEWSSRPALT